MIKRGSVKVDFIEYTQEGVTLHVSGEFEGGGQFWSKVAVDHPGFVEKVPE